MLFTNPLEIVKIRLQTQGEAVRLGTAASSKGTMQIISELGFFGLYKVLNHTFVAISPSDVTCNRAQELACCATFPSRPSTSPPTPLPRYLHNPKP